MSDYNKWAEEIKNGKIVEISDSNIVMMDKEYFNRMYIEPIIKDIEKEEE
ncbi:hypothetical protein [Pseudobutyrivibrio sp.]